MEYASGTVGRVFRSGSTAAEREEVGAGPALVELALDAVRRRDPATGLSPLAFRP